MFSAEEINTAEVETVLSIAFEEQRAAYNYFVNQINKHVTIHNSLSFNKILLMCQETIVMNQGSADIFNQLIQALMELHMKYGSKFVKKLYDYIKNKQTQEMSQFSGGISLVSLRSSQLQQQSQLFGRPDQLGMLSAQHRYLDLQKRKSSLRNSYNVLHVEKLQLKNIYTNVIQVKFVKYKELLRYQEQLCLKKEGVQDDLRLQVQRPQDLLKFDYVAVKAQLNYLEAHDPVVDSAKFSYKQLRRSQTRSPAPQLKFERDASVSGTGEFSHWERYEAMRKKIVIPLQSARYMLLQLKGIDFPTSRRLMMIKYVNRLKMLLKLYICYKKCLALMEFEYGDTIQLHCIAQQRFVLFQKLSQKFRGFILQQKLRQLQRKQQIIYKNYEAKVNSQIIVQMTHIQNQLFQQIQENTKKLEFVKLLRQQKQAFLNDKQKVRKILSIRILNTKKELKIEKSFIKPMTLFVFGKVGYYRQNIITYSNVKNMLAVQLQIIPELHKSKIDFLVIISKNIDIKMLQSRQKSYLSMLNIRILQKQTLDKQKQYLALIKQKQAMYVQSVPLPKLQTRHLKILNRYTSYNMSMLLVWRNVRDKIKEMELHPDEHKKILQKMASYYKLFITKQALVLPITQKKLSQLLFLYKKHFLYLELWYSTFMKKLVAYKKTILTLTLGVDTVNIRVSMQDSYILKKALRQKEIALSGIFLRQSVYMQDKQDQIQTTANKIYKMVQEMTHLEVDKSRWQRYFIDLIAQSQQIVQDQEFQKSFLNVRTDTELELLIQLSFQERQWMHDISSLELAKTIVILFIQQCTFQPSPVLLFPAVYHGQTMLFTGVYMQTQQSENHDFEDEPY